MADYHKVAIRWPSFTMANPLPRIILASASPRRRELLRYLDVEFEVRPSAVEEVQHPGESGEQYVARLAREKAEYVARSLDPAPAGAVVLGADTEVLLDGQPLGKPQSDAHAADMLRRLAGRPHDVVTGLCIVPLPHGRRPLMQEVVHTRVYFGPMNESEIAEYVASGEHRDKAGAYGIQGRAARFVTRIEGCYYNVMGLPVAALYLMLGQAGLT
jgi:septum formation protein